MDVTRSIEAGRIPNVQVAQRLTGLAAEQSVFPHADEAAARRTDSVPQWRTLSPPGNFAFLVSGSQEAEEMMGISPQLRGLGSTCHVASTRALPRALPARNLDNSLRIKVSWRTSDQQRRGVGACDTV